MNKFKLIILSVLIGLLGVIPVQAVPVTTATISVSAVVPNQSANMTLVVMQLNQPNQDPWGGTDVTASGTMNFGTLTYLLPDGSSAGVWYSPTYFCVFMFTSGFGKQYQVTSTSTGLASPTATLPAGSFGLTPQYIPEDRWVWPGGSAAQGAQPVGSFPYPFPTLGFSAVGTDILIYRSELAGSDRIIRAFYSLPPYEALGALPFPGYTPIPLSQPSGTYTGQVILTIAPI